ncbi:hypothetical protein F5Y16DRAFT_403197 [Xylariaceae sp. FL0255]|nr:hypothetical protein F5Y16DRAFT_403197 [Xylariaceae sp. FL0255]
MYSQVVSAGLFASAAMAAPYTFHKIPRDTSCASTDGTQPYMTELGWFTDNSCSDSDGTLCVYVADNAATGGSGSWACNPADLPDASTSSPIYAKVLDSAFPSMVSKMIYHFPEHGLGKYDDPFQIDFTLDQSCPPSAPAATFASLINNDACVELTLGGSGPGITLWPNGGSPINKRDTQELAPKPAAKKREHVQHFEGVFKKRDGTTCSGFTSSSQQETTSNTVQVSDIVNCINGAAAGCTISDAVQHTTSITTSYSLSAGGSLFDVLDVSATFGQDYTDSTATTIQENLTVQQGQTGYLASYSAATEFQGTFTGCSDGTDTQTGSAVVLRTNSLSYIVVNTGTP